MSDTKEEKKQEDVVVTHGEGGLPSFVNGFTVSVGVVLLIATIALSSVFEWHIGETLAIAIVCIVAIYLMKVGGKFAIIFFGGGGIILILASFVYAVVNWFDRWQATWALPRPLNMAETTTLQWSGPLITIWLIMVISSLTLAFTKWRIGIFGAILPSLIYSWWHAQVGLWWNAALVGMFAAVAFRFLSMFWGMGITQISSIKNQKLTMVLSTMYSSMVMVFYSPLQTWVTLYLSSSPEAAVAVFFGFGVGGTVAGFLLSKLKF